VLEECAKLRKRSRLCNEKFDRTFCDRLRKQAEANVLRIGPRDVTASDDVRVTKRVVSIVNAFSTQCDLVYCIVRLQHSDVTVKMLLDTGATLSLLPISLYCKIDSAKRQPMRPSPIDIRAGNGSTVVCHGISEVLCELDGRDMVQKFFVCADTTTAFLGMDFLFVHDVIMLCGLPAVTMDGIPLSICDSQKRPYPTPNKEDPNLGQ